MVLSGYIYLRTFVILYLAFITDQHTDVSDLCTLPRTWAIRTLFAFWWLAAMTLVASFTGNMMAMFAVAKAIVPFKSIDELVKRMKTANYKVIFQNTTNVRADLIQVCYFFYHLAYSVILIFPHRLSKWLKWQRRILRSIYDILDPFGLIEFTTILTS